MGKPLALTHYILCHNVSPNEHLFVINAWNTLGEKICLLYHVTLNWTTLCFLNKSVSVLLKVRIASTVLAAGIITHGFPLVQYTPTGYSSEILVQNSSRSYFFFVFSREKLHFLEQRPKLQYIWLSYDLTDSSILFTFFCCATKPFLHFPHQLVTSLFLYSTVQEVAIVLMLLKQDHWMYN